MQETILNNSSSSVKKSELMYVFKMLYDLGKINELEYKKAINKANEYQ